MREPHKERSSSTILAPSHAPGSGNGHGRSVDGVDTGQVWSSEITLCGGRPCLDTGKAIHVERQARVL